MRRVIDAAIAAIHQHPLLARIVIFFGVLALVIGHGAFLYYMRLHMGLSAGALAGVLLFVFIKHLGLLGPVLARFRRRPGVRPAQGTQQEAGKQ